MLIIMSICSVALFLACVAFSGYDFFAFKREMVYDLSTLAKITGKTNTAALVFDDKASAESTLATLGIKKYIVSAYIYSVDGSIFAIYRRSGFTENFLPHAPDEYGSSFRNGYLEVSEPIILDDNIVGTIYVKSELKELYSRLKQYGIIAAIIMAAAIAVVFLLSVKLQLSISQPILSLVKGVKRVSENKDYSVRIEEQGQEEFAILTRAFNKMLTQIQKRTMDLQFEIAERKHTEKELLNSQKQLVAVLNTVGDGIMTINSEGVIIMVNRTLCNIFGYSHDEIVGENIQILVPEKSRKKYLEGLTQNTETSKSSILGQRLELEGSRKEGSIFPLETCITETKIGEDLFYTAAMRDITERKTAEENLIRIMAAIEQSAEAVVIADIDATIQYVNPAFTYITGYTKEDAIGKSPVILKSGKQTMTFYKELWSKISNGEVWKSHFINKKKDGTLYEEDATISSVRDASGKIVNYVAVKRDVTYEVTLANQLRQAQKMEAIGMLAGGIAHDFNNLLGGIMGYANLIKLQTLDEKGVLKAAGTIEKASKRAAELTQQLLGFARMGKYENVVVDIHNTILDVIALIKRTIDKKIIVIHKFCTEPATILADPSQMHQVILNLSINASDAMPNDGKLIFVTEVIKADKEYCKTYTDLSPGKYIVISVTDTGHGIPKNIQSRIFEPFFTTKEIGKGTGMGLAMIYGIARNHSGLITVNSEEKKGATFKLYFPLYNGTTENKNEKEKNIDSSEIELTKGQGRILLVDDDDLLRSSVAAILNHLGYEVATAFDGQDAVEYYRKFGKSIDLIIMDLTMPRLNGAESFKLIKKINPDVKVILSTGYSPSDKTQNMLNGGMIDFIQKPYIAKQLSYVIAKALGNGCKQNKNM